MQRNFAIRSHPVPFAALLLTASLASCAALLSRQLPVALASAGGTAGSSTEPEPKGKPAVVVELFTSEGCSSCPPADDLLRRIANTQTDEGATIVALSEHVTYWNNLGWADPFASERFTERQDRYRTRLQLDEIYTPQMVVNGHTQFVGSDAGALRRALHTASQEMAVPLRIASLQRDGDLLTLRVQGSSTGGRKPLELWAAVTDDSDQSAVLRGENGGRTLRHAAVVRSLTRVGYLGGAEMQSVHVTLPDAVLRAPAVGHHVALLAQEPDQGIIRGAALASF